MTKNILNNILIDALENRASDIHFTQEQANKVRIKFRSGNTMIPKGSLDMEQYNKLVAYVKFHASMDLAHPMQPQSGSLTVENETSTVHCRVSILPTTKFTSLVLRVIHNPLKITIDDIPYFPENAKTLKRIIKAQSGLVLIAGTVSSGKSTTALALVDELKKQGRSVITIEAPIEYQPSDIVQIAVSKKSEVKPKQVEIVTTEQDYDYKVGIKEILRHDPDVIVIGEIQSADVAKQAIRAAESGHLVVATVHAKDVLGAIHRMLDFRISIDDLNQSLVAVTNQRLMPVNGGKKALMEIATNEYLQKILEQIKNNHVCSIPYTTLDEEFLQYKRRKDD